MRCLLLALLLGVSASALAAVDLDALWDFGQPVQSERRFRQALERQASPQSEDALVLRTQLARSLGLQQRYSAAHNELDAVELHAGEASPEVRVRLWLERGRVHRSAGDPARGLPLFEQAWALAEAEALWGLAGDALHMVALALPPGEAQLAAHERMVAFARGTTDPRARRWEGAALNNLADAHRRAGRLEQALAVFRESRLAYERQRSLGAERIARWQIAHTLRLMGRLDEALALQQALEQEHARGGSQDVHVFDELAALFDGRGDTAQAARYRGLAAEARRTAP